MMKMPVTTYATSLFVEWGTRLEQPELPTPLSHSHHSSMLPLMLLPTTAMARPAAAAAAARQQQWQCVRCESVHAILATCLRHCSSLVFSLPVLLALDGAWHIVGEVGGGVLAAGVAVAVAWRANSDGQPANNLCVTANCLPFAAVEP
jgi:hypothetical protein